MSLVATVVKADEPMTFPDLHVESGLAKSTTSRLLAALERTELLERNDDGAYVAGPLFWLYATRHDPWDELVRIARPTMEQVGDDTGETVNLSVTRGDRVVQVAQVDSTYMLGTKDWTEADVPVHASALGKVLLAYGTLELGRRAARAGHAEHHHRPGRRSGASSTRCVRNGWATTVDELEIGLTGVAVPGPRRRRPGDRGAGCLRPQPATRGSSRRDRQASSTNERSSCRRCCVGEHTREVRHDA